jgi:hypothetical protein
VKAIIFAGMRESTQAMVVFAAIHGSLLSVQIARTVAQDVFKSSPLKRELYYGLDLTGQ